MLFKSNVPLLVLSRSSVRCWSGTLKSPTVAFCSSVRCVSISNGLTSCWIAPHLLFILNSFCLKVYFVQWKYSCPAFFGLRTRNVFFQYFPSSLCVLEAEVSLWQAAYSQDFISPFSYSVSSDWRIYSFVFKGIIHRYGHFVNCSLAVL